MTRTPRLSLGPGPLAAFACAALAGAPVASAQEAPAPAAGAPARAVALYEKQCALCHGPQGRGDGPAAYLLDPAPRNFASGRFRLVSTRNGVPSERDLVETIRNGMPGSAMPPWEWLAEEELVGLARHVRALSIDGQVAELLRRAAEEDDELSEAEARALVEERMVPGEVIEPGPAPAGDPLTLNEGRRTFIRLCASCHGESGNGDSPVNLSGELVNEDGTPNSARDFTAGILKGGATHADIVRRIVAGLPGSPMPANRFDDPAELAALAAFVRSLVKPGAQEQVAQHRSTLTVARAPGRLPTEPVDPAWARAEGAWIALMPLWWRNQRVEGVVVRALHDGEAIAVRLSWRDASDDEDLLSARSFSDAAALQLTQDQDPPLFAMGAAGRPVEIAFWRAAWRADASAARGMHERWPAMVDDGFPELVGDLLGQSLTARAVGNSQAAAARPSEAEDVSAEGLGTVGPRPGAQPSWSARGLWKDGYWDVVFSRALEAGPAGEPALSPGQTAFIAFAVWDGASGDRNGQKSVSVWHGLVLEP